jgi:LacI family transcriptional regulator
MVTAREIAEALGVSISTVGRALADDPRISSETKSKVKKAADKAGYVGNMPAQMMRGGSSNLIGLIVPDIRNDFYAAIAQALSATCGQEGKRLVLAITGDDRDAEARNIRELAGARAAGVIIVPTAAPRRESIRMLQALPHVQLLRNIAALGSAWFGINDEQALRAAAAHLLDLGHRRIAYVGGHETLSTGASRVAGFRNAYEQLRVNPRGAIECLGAPTQEFGAGAIAQLMRRPKPPTAIVSGSVHITLGLIEAVERLRIDVPDSVSMIGFGDPQWFSWWRGGLTTVRPPIQELATACGLWLLQRLKSRDAVKALDEQSAMTNSTLVLRETVRPI